MGAVRRYTDNCPPTEGYPFKRMQLGAVNKDHPFGTQVVTSRRTQYAWVCEGKGGMLAIKMSLCKMMAIHHNRQCKHAEIVCVCERRICVTDMCAR